MQVPEADALAAELTRELDELRERRFRGQDPAGLVAVTVDGHGLVEDVRFLRSLAPHHPNLVGEAVCAAVDAAQRSLGDALGALAARAEAASRRLTAGEEVAAGEH